jgi:hypothetical protein
MSNNIYINRYINIVLFSSSLYILDKMLYNNTKKLNKNK